MLRIELFSDTMTKPSAAMRRAMAEAEVGDEQRQEDPTTNRLQDMVAELLGKEAALFLPSGTMCNQVGIRVHTKPGDEVYMDRSAHPFNHEGGGHAALSGATVYPLDGARGIYTPEQLERAMRPKTYMHPRSRLACVEQTTNLGGGAIWPLEQIRGVCAVARKHGLSTHLDGARLFNAVVATGVSARDYAATFDSAWIDLSKGLGCPVGGVIAGSKAFIDEAWHVKHQLGGALRQSGILAAAGIYALENNIERLAEDHANAKRLAEGLAELKGVRVELPIESNLVFFDVAGLGVTGDEFRERLMAEGVRFSPGMGRTRLRAVTHLDVTHAQIDEALAAVHRVANEIILAGGLAPVGSV